MLIKNRIIYDSVLDVLDQPDKTDFRQFTSDTNVIEVLAPLASDYTLYGIAQPVSKQNGQRDTDRHKAEPYGTEEIDGETYRVWHFKPRNIVFTSPTATLLSFEAEFLSLGELLGIEYVPSTTTVDTFLKQRYDNATSGDVVRVVAETDDSGDYEFNGTVWNLLAEPKEIYPQRHRTNAVSWSIERGKDAGYPYYDPSTYELLASEIDDRVRSTELENNYFNKSTSDGRYVNSAGDTMSGPLDMFGNKITSVENPTNPQDASTKGYTDGEVADHNDDATAHPAIRQEIDDDIGDHNVSPTAHNDIRQDIGTINTTLTEKVDKTLTILGIDHQDNITLTEFMNALRVVSTNDSGIMTAQDKQRLDALYALLGESPDPDSVVNTINEVLAIFEQYPEGADLVSALAGKVDKVEGYGLSQNDFTDTLLDKLTNLPTDTELQASLNDIDIELQRLETIKADTTYLEQRIQDLATKHGLEDSSLGSLAVNETISNTVMTEQLKVILNVRLDENEDFSVIQPNMFEIGDVHTFEIGTGAVGTRETATITKTDASTWTFTSTDATVVLNLTGIKLKKLSELAVDNQDDGSTDLLSFAIIDGKLAYEIKESE